MLPDIRRIIDDDDDDDDSQITFVLMLFDIAVYLIQLTKSGDLGLGQHLGL